MYRRRNGELQVFLVHPGGPLWVKRDLGAWSIPKGEYLPEDDPLQAAIREFGEETGFSVEGEFIDLGTIKQVGGKIVSAWAVQGDCDPGTMVSNRFELEWPPRSGRMMEFPEVDRGEWFSIEAAKEHILPAQQVFLDLLARKLATG